MAPRASFLDYLWGAFSWRWNLLVGAAAAAFSILSGRPDVGLPLVAAAEIAYLGLLSTHPRFRKSIDARKITPRTGVDPAEQRDRILKNLSPQDSTRFASLRNRCITLDNLGKQFRGLETSHTAGLNDIHIESLNRLLWMFLKLLYSKDALSRFLKNTDRNGLESEIRTTADKLDEVRQTGQKENLAKSLEDKLATMRERLRNYDAAQENFELIQAELERMEQKIAVVSELSLSSSDPAMLSSQVDGITDSLSVTAEAIRKLDVVPDIDTDEAPAFLRQETS